MPTYKLHYLNYRARAEVIRQLFFYGDIDFEDIRYSAEEWVKVKPTMPLGQVPVLEVDGKMIPQSGAILRLIAKKVGMYGNDDMECADIDVILDTCGELWPILPSIYKENDPVKKAAAIKRVTEEVMPSYLDKFERLLEKTDGFFVRGRMTVADLHCINDLLWPRDIGVPISLDNHPKLKTLEMRVHSHPKIAAWIAQRPHTDA